MVKRNRRTRKVTPLMVFTIGHSTRPIDVFIRLLKAHGVQRVVDVRTIPKSRHNPQFDRDRLSPTLHGANIHYRHMPGRGLRHASPDSAKPGRRNTSFRGYADYMQTLEFEDSLARCIDLAKQERVVLMCAEAVPWRCHRSLIADALLARGIDASEITSGIRTRPHELTPWARVKGYNFAVVDDVSALLRAWTHGDQRALARLTPIVYDELHRLAHYYLKR
jgi:hypothetical protein